MHFVVTCLSVCTAGSRGDYLTPFLPASVLVATGAVAERPLTVQEAAETRARCVADCMVRVDAPKCFMAVLNSPT